MSNMNKKGVSEVVQVVLIMALSIMAITMVSKYVLTLSGNLENQLSPAVDCFTMKSKVLSVCNQGNQIKVIVKTGEEENPSLKISTGEEVFDCNTNSCSTCQLTEGITKTIYLNPLDSSTDLTYQFDSCSSQTIPVTACATP